MNWWGETQQNACQMFCSLAEAGNVTVCDSSNSPNQHGRRLRFGESSDSCVMTYGSMTYRTGSQSDSINKVDSFT